jgi:hypothetical protein
MTADLEIPLRYRDEPGDKWTSFSFARRADEMPAAPVQERKFAIDGRTLRAWMRGADLKAPKWKTATVYLNEKYKDKSVAPFSVSAASVTRAKARAAVAKPAPIIQPATMKAADIEQVDYGTTIAMMMDGLFTDTGVATQRRVYDAEEQAMLARWTRGLFSQVKYDAGPFPVRWTKKGGLILEARPCPVHQRRQIPRHLDQVPTDQDTAAAFGLMRYWAKEINAGCARLGIKPRCNAKTESARAYQAGCYIRDYHRLRMGIGMADIVGADIVTEAVAGHLRRPGRIDWTQRTAVLDVLEGASSYEVGDRFGRDPSSIRERLDSELVGIEAKLGPFCGHIWQPPQARNRPCDNISENTSSEPWRAPRYLTPADRTALVLRYVALAGAPISSPMASDAATAWLRDAYKSVATYLESGGRILTGHLPQRHLPERWFVDKRRAALVEEEGWTGSRHRDLGLDPFSGRHSRPRPVTDLDRLRRVYSQTAADIVQDAQSGL